MRKKLVFFIFCCLSFASLNLGPFSNLANAKPRSANGILSYDLWKSRRVQEARDVYHRIIRELKSARQISASPTKLIRLNRRVEQARTNIDIAKELNSHDYFIAYLTEHFPGDRVSLLQAINKMSSSDIAEILIQYQSNILASRGSRSARTIQPLLTENSSTSAPDFDRAILGKAGDL